MSLGYLDMEYSSVKKLPTVGYAMADPRSNKAIELAEMFLTDAVPSVTTRIMTLFDLRYIPVNINALSPEQLMAYCRYISRERGTSVTDIMLDVSINQGIMVDGQGCVMFSDPDVGREFWRSKFEKEEASPDFSRDHSGDC